jgi:hypothetical protein
MPEHVKALSDAIIEPITKAYRVGGFGLAFLLLGAVMLLTAALSPIGYLAYPLALVGFVLVAVPCYFFYVKEVQPLARAQKSLTQASELADTVQAAAMQATNLAYDLQALAFRYASQIMLVFEEVRPVMRRIPGISGLADLPVISNTDALAGLIVTGTKEIEQVVGNLEKALVNPDPKLLKTYIEDMKRIKTQLEALLASPLLSKIEGR